MMEGMVSNRHESGENVTTTSGTMANRKHSAEDIHRGVGVYFRGCVSNDDTRQLIYGAVICNRPNSSRKRLIYLSCSIDGEIIVDYQAERNNNLISNQIDKLPCVLPNIFGLFKRESEQYAKLIGQEDKNDMVALYYRAANSSSISVGK